VAPGQVEQQERGALRKVDNDAERLLWSELRDRRLNGYKFVRQFPVGPYFADFACREEHLIIEVDGSQHAGSARDQIRDRFLTASGWSVLRLWNVDVLKEREAVVTTILAAVEGQFRERIVSDDLRFTPFSASRD
jgi:very-short-patch-repair endonuclease